MADVAHQGMSSIFNEDKLGNDRQYSSRLMRNLTD